MLDHYRWLIGLEKQGKVFASGPMFDKNGDKSAGVTVFSTETWEEAESLAAEGSILRVWSHGVFA